MIIQTGSDVNFNMSYTGYGTIRGLNIGYWSSNYQSNYLVVSRTDDEADKSKNVI